MLSNLKKFVAGITPGSVTVSFKVSEINELIAEFEDMERSYSHQLGEIARLSSLTCGWINKMLGEQPTVLAGIPEEVVDAMQEIMQYVDAVQPGDVKKKTKWVMHIIGPDDVIPCVGEFDALRKANRRNISFAKIMANGSSPNDPYCVAVAELA